MTYTDDYLNDLALVQDAIPHLDELRFKKILITGANGLICSALVDFFLQLNDTTAANVDIYAAARDYKRITHRFQDRTARADFHFVPYDALEPLHCDVRFDYLIHGAGNANPAAYVNEPVETMLANIVGLKSILDYARACGGRRVLYISSSEVYGRKDNTEPYSEDDYGYVDILNMRACYPSAKRAAETLCVAYQAEFGVETVIVRPGHVYGPTATDGDTRASSQFPRDVINGKDIVMKSAGAQIRSYCYVLDCVSAILTVLLRGESGGAYNISNRDSIVSIRQMAECFAKTGGRNIVFDVPTEAEKAGYNLMDNSSLNAEKLESLGWRGRFDLPHGVKATLDIISEGR